MFRNGRSERLSVTGMCSLEAAPENAKARQIPEWRTYTNFRLPRDRGSPDPPSQGRCP
jgi:hypothetical protein